MIDPLRRANSLKPTVLTTAELAIHLRVSEVTIQRYCRQKKIPFFHIGNEYRFNLGEVIEALKKCKNESTESEDNKIFT
jgi:excisionase family DNA binding protein